MVRIINFLGRKGMLDIPSFVATDNEVLTLKFKGLDLTRGRYKLTIKHGALKKTCYLGNTMAVDLSAEWVNENAKPIECFLELRDEAGTNVLIRSAKSINDCAGFFIEPLKIEQAEDGYSFVAWFQQTEKLIYTLQEELKTVKYRLSKYEDNGIPLCFDK